MVLSKEHQEVMVNSYLATHTVAETEAFMEGMDAMIKLIDKQSWGVRYRPRCRGD